MNLREAKSIQIPLAELSLWVLVLYYFCYIIVKYKPTFLMFKSFFPFSKRTLHVLK